MKKAREARNVKILQKLMQETDNKRCMDCLERVGKKKLFFFDFLFKI